MDEQSPTGGATRVSARWRIVSWIVLTTALALLAVTVTMRSILMGQVAENANAEIVQEIGEFRTFASEGVDPTTARPFTSTSALVERYLARQTPSTGEAIIGVIGAEVLFTDNSRADAGEILAKDRNRLDRILNDPSTSGMTSSEHGELRWGRITVQPAGGGMPPGTIVVAHFTQIDQERVDQEAVLLFGVAAGGLLLTGGIAWLAAGRILQPLRRMREVAESITAQDLSARIPVPGRDDISGLAVTLNHMLDRVERAYASQRHFVAEARLHLSAPLRRAVAAINDASSASSGVQRQAAAQRATHQLDLMRETLAALDILAQSDNPDFVSTEQISLKELTAGLYAEAVTYRDRRWELEATAEGIGWLDGSRVLEAMRQLFDNAVSHTGSGETLMVGSARHQDETVSFWVTNQGPRLDQEQAEALFEVYRTESEDDADRGMGLGLAVVKAVADAHGGSAWVESGPDATRFGIDLPVTPPTAAGRASDLDGDEP